MPHVLLDRSFADANIQLEQFAPDPFRSPESIVLCHLLDQRNGLCRHLRLRRLWF